MHSRRDRIRQMAVRLLITIWLAYSGGVLAWWAYTEPGSGVCFGKAPNQPEGKP